MNVKYCVIQRGFTMETFKRKESYRKGVANLEVTFACFTSLKINNVIDW
jgi:hypothetical protein